MILPKLSGTKRLKCLHVKKEVVQHVCVKIRFNFHGIYCIIFEKLIQMKKIFKCFILTFVYFTLPNLPAPSFLFIRTLVQYSHLRTHSSHFYETILP